MRKLTSLFLLVAAMLGCKYLKPEQKLDSEAADQQPPPAVSVEELKLNNEDMGDTADLAPLRSRISEIMKLRGENAVFREGTNELENQVYLVADPNLRIGTFADIAFAVNNSRGAVLIPVGESPDEPEFAKPNPLTLVLSIGKARIGEPSETTHGIFYIDYSRLLTIEPRIEVVESKQMLKIYRLLYNSIEISADDRYFLNLKNPAIGERSDPDDVDVTQHPVEDASVETQLPNAVYGEPPLGSELQVIVSRNASFGSLLRLLKAAHKNKFPVSVYVRPQKFEESPQ